MIRQSSLNHINWGVLKFSICPTTDSAKIPKTYPILQGVFLTYATDRRMCA